MNSCLKLDLCIREPMQICIHRKDNSPKPVNHRLTLNNGQRVKSDKIRRFLAHDMLQVGFTLQTSRINNKRVISTFKIGCPHLILKEGSKAKCHHIKRFPNNDFLSVGFSLQTSWTNNKQVISTFKFGYPRLALKEGSKVKSEYITRFPAHDFL